MSKIFVYKVKPQRMKPDKFTKIARYLEIKNKPVETDEALLIRDSSRALAYGQPEAKCAGLLFYTDQSKGVAEAVVKLLDVKRAKRWADEFLQRFDLIPRKVEDKRVDFRFDTTNYQTEAVTFDGKERRKSKVKTEIGSKIVLNGTPVVGPRAKVRMIFKGQESPILIHRGLWEDIEVYEEREVVREHDIVKVVREKLTKRRNGRAYYNVIDIKLAYFAHEFNGGPDILAPFYFIEVEYEDINAEKKDVMQGLRQIFWLPAYR